MANLEKIAQEILELYRRVNNNQVVRPRQVFVDTMRYPVTKEEAVEALRNENIRAIFPDGSAYLRGQIVKLADPAHTASPEALRKLNDRIATMSLPPRRLTRRPYNIYALGQWNFKEEE